ncbi:MAG: flagellar motor switch protein FliM [Thermodesulfobacteriota bacterium]
MSKVLSQEEVDALLKGMSGGEIETESAEVSAQSEYELYDFVNQSRVIKAKMPTFDALNDQFARSFRVTLTTILRRIVDITVQPFEVQKFSDFAKNLPVPTSLHIFKTEPLRGSALFVLDSRLVFYLVECFLGGSGKGRTKIEGREFTPIEQRLISRVVHLAFADLEKVWHPVHPVKIQYVRSEINPQFARIVHPNDPLIVSRYTVEMDDLSGQISICMPFANIEPIKLKLMASFQKEHQENDPYWSQQVRDSIRKIQVGLRVELGKTTMSANDIAKLTVGDIIRLNKDLGEPLSVDVEGIPRFNAYAGIYKGNKAFQLLGDVSAD